MQAALRELQAVFRYTETMSVLDRYDGWIRAQQVQMEVLETELGDGDVFFDALDIDPADGLHRERMAQRETLNMLLGQNPAMLPLTEVFNMLRYAERKVQRLNDQPAASGIHHVMLAAYAQVGAVLIASLVADERDALEEEAAASGQPVDSYVWDYIGALLSDEWESS